MAARGAEVKEKLTQVLTKLFPESFMDGKTLRIPMKENGEIVEIKVTLTAAKDVLGGASADTFTLNVALLQVTIFLSTNIVINQKFVGLSSFRLNKYSFQHSRNHILQKDI